METSDVRKRIKDALERAQRQAAERRTRNAEASAAYETFLHRTAVPVFQQVANVLRVEGYPFVVHTPAGSVRLASEKSGNDYVELRLDTTGERLFRNSRSNASCGTISFGTGVCRSRQEINEPYRRAKPPPATSMPVRGGSWPSSMLGSRVKWPSFCAAS